MAYLLVDDSRAVVVRGQVVFAKPYRDGSSRYVRH